jgi:polar amino acid transport system substrate-binding protein
VQRPVRLLRIIGALALVVGAAVVPLASPASSAQSAKTTVPVNPPVAVPDTVPAPNTSPAPSQNSRTKLRVSTKKIEPFVFVGEDKTVTGFSVDLWNELAKSLNVETEWVVRDTVKELIADVADESSEVAIAGISMTPEREAEIDFSHSYFDSGLQILVRQTSSPNPVKVFLKTLTSSDIRYPLLLVFGFAVLVAHVIWLVERGSNEDFPKPYFAGIWEGFWWASVNVMTGGDAEKKVGNGIARLVALAWMVIGLMLVAYLGGSVASALTVSQLQSNIKGVSDLPGKRVITTTGSVAAQYLDNFGVPYTSVDSLGEDTYQRVINKEIDAIVYDSPTLRFAANRYGKDQLAVVGSIFAPDKYGIALRSSSDIREQINGTLLELQKNGKIEEFTNKWFGRSD